MKSFASANQLAVVKTSAHNGQGRGVGSGGVTGWGGCLSLIFMTVHPPKI